MPSWSWNNIPNTVFDIRDNIPNTETVLGIFFLSLIPNSVSTLYNKNPFKG